MNPIVRNVIAVVSGIVVGSVVNMGIITLSSSVIPPPQGVDVNNMDALKTSMHLFEPKHFLFPFLAHAVGTFAGALLAAVIAANNKMRIALGIGVFFLIGGFSAIFMLPSPLWFSIVDLVGAYLPIGFLGAKLAMRIS